MGLDPIDLRWGFDRLAGIVAERLGREARSGALFGFFGKRRESLKVLFFDGTGLCLFYKRLDSGTFRLPPVPEGTTTLALEERVLDGVAEASSTTSRRRSSSLSPSTFPIAGFSILPVFLPGWPLLVLPIHIVFLELVIDPASSLTKPSTQRPTS